MADWWIRLREFAEGANGNIVGEFSLMQPSAEIRNSEPGGFSGELALSHLWRGSTTRGIGRDSFAPYRTHWELYRQSSGNGKHIESGMLTSVNLNKDRDTILIAGRSWLHWLQRRIYPFNPVLYKNGGWTQWPRRWPDMKGAYGPQYYKNSDPIDLTIIVRQLVQSTQFEPPTEVDEATFPVTPAWPSGADPTVGRIRITQSIPLMEEYGRYAIYPGDQTSIFDHIKKVSEQATMGFEFDIHPMTQEFQLWHPRRNANQGLLYYLFMAGTEDVEGAITEFDWTNEGPEGTYLLGLAKKGKNVGNIWTTQDNLNEFGRYDKVYDFGEISEDTMILDLLKDQNDLHPQKKLQLAVLNPEYMTPNFYTGNRPRALLGASVGAMHNFRPYHTVNADFRINAIKWDVDTSGNENAALELEMVYDP